MLVFTLVTLLGLVLQSTADSAVPKYSNRDSRWQRKFLAPRDGPLRLHIAPKLDDNGFNAEHLLTTRSNPYNPKFRQWLTADQASVLSIPRVDSFESVENWLSRYGMLKNTSVYGGIFQVDTTIRHAERLLNTTYFVWSDGSREIVRNERYYLPPDIWRLVDFVTPTSEFPRPAKLRGPGDQQQVLSMDLLRNSVDEKGHLETRSAANCGSSDYTTPTCIRQIYDINYTAKPNRTTFAVYATEGASFKPSDLHTYLSTYNPAAAAADASYLINGAGDSNETGGIGPAFETALDTQTFLGLAFPAQGILYNRGGVFGPHAGQVYDPFVQFLHEMIHNATVPSVVSFSESMPEDQIDADYAKRLCNMMAQVGARGVTLLFSSGDNGPNGDQPTGKHNAVFEPEFPASCPWVTAVGGTTNLADETAATQATIGIVGRISYTASGGGFSNLFSVPNYQAGAVRSYVTRNVPASYDAVSGFNPRGRGIPDVSAFSTNFPTIVDGFTAPVGGTSASTPLWGAVVALLNDYEASHGRPSLGFINPWLYSLKQNTGLKDIITGGNNVGACYFLAGCHLPRTLGYNVSVGWDPVTGLGSPRFGNLTQALDAAAAAVTAAAANSRNIAV